MDLIARFILWFILSAVGVYFIQIFLPNEFLVAFVVAIIIAVVATKEKER